MPTKFYILVLITVFISVIIYPQTKISNDTLETKKDTTFVMQKSATLAMLKSAALPGWGQFYNESYWKIPVVWGFLGYYISVWISQNNKYNFYKKEYSNSILSDTPEGNLQVKKFRDFYHNQRDEFTIYIFITYFLNIVDAYVDSHLFDFNVTPELDKVQLRINIKL